MIFLSLKLSFSVFELFPLHHEFSLLVVELAERFRQLHDARVICRRFGGRHLFVGFRYQPVELVYPLFAFLYRGYRAAQLALALLAAFVVLAALAHGLSSFRLLRALLGNFRRVVVVAALEALRTVHAYRQHAGG